MKYEFKVTDGERASLRVIVDLMSRQGTPVPDPTDQQIDDAFSMGDSVLEAIQKMRKSLGRGTPIQEAQQVLRVTAAGLCYTQAIALKHAVERRVMNASAAADMPVAYHCIMVQCYADGTFTVRLESAALKYEGGQAESVNVEAFAPPGRHSPDQTAQHIFTVARMLAHVIADTDSLQIVREVSGE